MKILNWLWLVVAVCLPVETPVFAQDDPGARVTMPSAPPGYVLGPGDVFVLEIADLEELNGKAHRIDKDGTVTLPLVGRMKAAGYTLPEFEEELDRRLLDQLKEPHITVTVTEILSQPVTVLGQVNAPGVHQLRGPQTLAGVLSMAGGLKPDAGYRVTITRKISAGKLPLPGAYEDIDNKVITGEVSLNDIVEAKNPAMNIEVVPFDVVTVPRAKIVYVMGEVRKQGGFTLDTKNTISILQLLALAEGTTPNAKKTKAVVMREEPGSDRRSEIPVDLTRVLNGKDPEMMLGPNDILFVPHSTAHVVTVRTIETAVAVGTGILIWRGL
jgi:polysaccharide export outer membrane protein